MIVVVRLCFTKI